VEPCGVLQEPRPATELRGSAVLLRGGEPASQALHERRPLHCGRHADPLIQAWASQKSYRTKDGSEDSDGTNFHGQKRSNETHASTTDPDARSYKKSYGKESKLSYLGHVLIENRNGLIASAMVTHADGHAERDAALLMLHARQKDRSRRIIMGADKAYDTRDFVAATRALNVTGM